MIAKRVKCHGNKMHCMLAHPAKTKNSIEILSGPKATPKTIVKESWFKKLLRFLRIIK